MIIALLVAVVRSVDTKSVVPLPKQEQQWEGDKEAPVHHPVHPRGACKVGQVTGSESGHGRSRGNSFANDRVTKDVSCKLQ